MRLIESKPVQVQPHERSTFTERYYALQQRFADDWIVVARFADMPTVVPEGCRVVLREVIVTDTVLVPPPKEPR